MKTKIFVLAMLAVFMLSPAIYAQTAEEWKSKGDSLAHEGKLDESLNCYVNYAELQTDKHIVFYNFGKIFQKSENYKKAIFFFNKTIEADSNYTDAWYNLGLCYKILDNTSEAINSFIKVITIDDHYSDGYLQLGIIMQRHNEFIKAINLFDIAITLEKENDNSTAWINKGVCYYHLKNFKKSIECYDEGIKLKPNDYASYHNKGTALDDLKEYEAAIKCFDRTIELKPDFHAAWSNKGISLVHLKKYVEGIKCFKRAIELDSEGLDAYFNLAWVYSMLKNKSEMLRYLKITINKNPNYIELAKTQEAFKEYWDDPDFIKLTK